MIEKGEVGDKGSNDGSARRLHGRLDVVRQATTVA
jgi:hypothetical protein